MDPNLLTANNDATESDAAALVAGMRARGIRFVVYHNGDESGDSKANS